ncbi:transcription factor bHLH68-like isoform X3 [Phragmites australis]|uniref:transcription factor bHLH68-like isoform X3 n=1 Tax=Phragmites australis TaxID=29695 RepID=UPI002D76BFDB|nr:transcription factor bHLH68-like isoform X3 [Phragmites australis]
MTGGGEFKSSLVQQQMIWSGTDNKNMMSSLMPCSEEQEAASPKMPRPLSSPSMLLPQQLLQISSGLAPGVNRAATTSLSIDLSDGQESNMQESWSQLLLGGLVDHERYSTATDLLSEGLEEGPMHHTAAAYNFYGHGGEEIQTSGTNKSQVSQMLLASSPRSCTTISLGSNMLDFSNSTVPAPELRNHHSDNSSEGNGTASGSAPKKARVQTSSSAQSTLKVRKERLGDRITALQQIVSPFGKALSYPYLGHGTGNGNSMQQQTDAENGGEGKKDLTSRGLCLVPVSCTSHLPDDNAASDFWAVAPPPLGGIVWR